MEHIVAQDQDRPEPGLFPAADRIEVGPTNLSPQYSGQESELPARPSSARAFSSSGSSFAHSRAKRVRRARASFSARAVSMALLVLLNSRRATSSSTRSSN